MRYIHISPDWLALPHVYELFNNRRNPFVTILLEPHSHLGCYVSDSERVKRFPRTRFSDIQSTSCREISGTMSPRNISTLSPS